MVSQFNMNLAAVVDIGISMRATYPVIKGQLIGRRVQLRNISNSFQHSVMALWFRVHRP